MEHAGDRGRVRLAGVSISYGGRAAVRDVSLDIAPGEFVCLLGPSGCGKTTTLRAIAGLTGIDAGAIHIDGALATHLPAHRRGIAMVFQDLALFPHMTVFENVAFGLTLRQIDAATIRAKISAMMTMLHLDGLQDRLPRQLSGGQQQRVALARSLVVDPSVLLLDEPFAALDRKLREEMRREIRSLQRRLEITVVFVTHDQEEALTMSDRVVVMNHGSIEQVGAPSEVYEAPANRFVMDFVGFSNFLRMEAVTDAHEEIRCRIGDHDIRVARRAIPGAPGARRPELALRPERIRLAPLDREPRLANRLRGTIHDVAYEGALLTYEVSLADGQKLFVREQNSADVSGTHRYQKGDPVGLEWRPEDGMLVG
jgi:spermidine/putrescine ABC transporter ATP-binding subunit